MSKKKKTSKQSEELQEENFFKTIGDSSGENNSSLEQLHEQPEWIDEEDEAGQLSVDVFEDGDTIVIKSTIAGVEPDDIDISIVNDLLTIRGERKLDKSHKDREYFFQECYWGAFSRSIILPVEVDTKSIDATIKNGILTVTLPKAQSKEKKKITIKDENE